VLARELGNPRVLGQVHRTRVQLYIWSGRIEEAREAAQTALEICAVTGDRGVEFWSRWAQAALEGLIGKTAEMAAHIELAQAIADEIASPFLDLATRELAIELAYARGEWELGIRMGRRAIELARATHQQLILPRLLVWVSLMHIGRDELDVADRLTREAWETSGAEHADSGAGFIGLHAVVPAHIGRATYHMARGEWSEAIRMAEAGLRLADRSGYIVWAIHHVLPIIAEAAIHARDLPRAEAAGRRLREEAERIGHPLGLAWADACDALLAWLRNDALAGVTSLEAGARALESIPMTYEAARVRRQLAGRLAEVGDRDRALAELAGAWRVLESIGAKRELERARDQYREMGAEPPPAT
jgi:tetratricopeptide (TPR) repeat protein